MDIDMDLVSGVTGVCSIAGAVFYYAVIKPLTEQINGLRSAVDRLNMSITRVEEKRQDMDKRLVKVEESVKSAHHRLDGLERS